MKTIIQPSNLRGVVQAPASKSSMQRACAAALLHKGETIILNPGNSNDDKAAIEIVKKLGVQVHFEENKMTVQSQGFPNDSISDNVQLNCGESGLSIRMFTSIAALSDKQIIISGEGSLMQRPMSFFDEMLPQLGVTILSDAGKLPLSIKGPLQFNEIEIDGSLSSQFLTGLLMAYSQSDKNNVSLKVKNLNSKPYVDLTLSVIKHFELNTPENKIYKEFVFQKKEKSGKSVVTYTVESDWSSAAFLLVAGAIAGPISIRGLSLLSTQADKKIFDVLLEICSGIAIDAKGIIVHPVPMNAFNFDATDCPDLFPPLAVLAAYCNGVSTIKGVSRLAHKESNRAITLQEELGKMGVKIEWDDDVMKIYGGGKLNGAVVHSHNDHRIAMACAVAALKAEGTTTIEHADAIKKSYPDFFKDLKKLGAAVSLPFQQFNL